jgi:acetyl-CoA C-acetyltransferase
MKKVGIIAVEQTKFEAARVESGFSDLVFETTGPAVKKAGLTRDDIDQIVTASQDFWDGRTISNFAVSEACGSYLKPESKAAMDATMAVFYSLARILSGAYKTGLVTTHCKMSQGPQNVIYNAVFDPMYQRQLGVDFINAHAFQARAYMDKYGVGPEQWAEVTVKNKKNALSNPKAMDGRELTIDDVMNSPMLADPIRELDCMPVSDGAATIIMAEEETARKLCDKPVWIKGIASYMDNYYFGDRDLAETAALEKAAKRAYNMAGITDPKKDVDVVELTEFFSYQEPMWAEGLGLCDKGKGGDLIKGKISTMDGSLPINASGGVLAGNPHTVAGMVRVIEAYNQLTGKAGEAQKEGAKTAVVQSTTGPCGQSHCVMVLSTD